VSAEPRELARSARILVCVGCGGVGKTTLAAAFALEAARAGRRALVLTIDPARRLADALGTGPLDNEPRAIPRETLDALEVPPEGALSAMMLDMKRTFDDLVERFAEDPASQRRILENPIYQHVSDALAGSAEYSAMEKVYELTQRQDFDLIVVDTPPSQHALDFLEAPQRLLEFLDSPVVKLLVHPAMSAGRFGFRLFQRGAQRVLKLVERVSGVAFLQDISDFLLAFEGMSEGFAERAREVRALLVGAGSSFVLVAGPARESTLQATTFLDRLESAGVPLAGLVVNRVRTWPRGGTAPRVPDGDPDAAHADLARALAARFGSELPAEEAATAAIAAAKGYADLVRADAAAVAPLLTRADQQGRFWRLVPELPRDVHDLTGLALIAGHVFAGDDAPREARHG